MTYPVVKEKPFRLEKEKSALLIIDMQNDFIRKGAKLEVAETRKTIDAHKKLIQYFRENDLVIVYTKFIAGPKYTLMLEWAPECGSEHKTCWKGVKKRYKDSSRELDGSDIIDEIYPKSEDYVIEKYGYNSFYNTILEDLLRSNGIEYLVTTGVVTEICIDDTVRGAFHKQFKSIVAEDAVSSNSSELHNATLKSLKSNYSRVEKTIDIINEFEGE